MRPRKLTFAENLAHPPLPPGVKRGVETNPLFKTHLSTEQVVTGGPTASELVRQTPAVQGLLTRAIARHKLTDSEVKRILSMANGWAAKKHTVVDIGRITTAIKLIVNNRQASSPKERPPREQRLKKVSPVQEPVGSEWSTSALRYVPIERSPQSLLPQSTPKGTTFPIPLVLTVTDNGNPVKGVAVTFTVQDNNACGTFPFGNRVARAFTAADGNAIAPALTAGQTVGAFTVVAKVLGISTPIVFMMTVTSPEKHNPLEKAAIRTPFAGELGWPIPSRKILTRAVSKYKMTSAEVERVILVANVLAAKKKNEANNDTIANAIGIVLGERK